MTSPDRPTVEPADVEAVERFLEALDDDTPVGVRAQFGVRHRRVFATAVERIPPSPRTGAHPPFFTVSTNDGTYSVKVDHIERLTAYETPLTRREYDVDGAANADRDLANRVRKAAIQAPGVVNVAHPLELLRSDDRTTHSHALSALFVLCRDRPGDCALAIPSLVTVLESGTTDRPGTALGCLAHVADDHPREVAPWVDRLRGFAAATDERTQTAALRLLSNVAAADAAACIDALPALEAVVAADGGDDGSEDADGDGDRREHAVYVAQRVAQDAPTAVEPLVPALGDALADTDNATVAANATIALGTVSKQYPGVALDAVEPAVRWLDADEHVARNNAMGMLADVALHNAHAIAPHVDHVRALVHDEDDYARINATGVLARLAQTAPDCVDSDVDLFLDALADDQHLVRVNACWALGELGTLGADVDRVRDRLETLETADENEAVRRRASWALDQVTTGRHRS